MQRPTTAKTVIVHDADAFEAWLDSLRNVHTKQIIRRRLTRLGGGNLGDCVAVGDGVHEVRIDHGPGFRLYFANDGDAIIIILHSGTKNRQQADIVKAKTIWQEIKDGRAKK